MSTFRGFMNSNINYIPLYQQTESKYICAKEMHKGNNFTIIN